MSSRSRNNGDGPIGAQNIDVMYSLKVDNLTYRTRVEDLRRYFDRFGPIGDIYIPRDQFSRSSRGYAFIRYVGFFLHIFFSPFCLFLDYSLNKKRDSEDALDRMDGKDIDGREIRVQFARYGRASTTDSREKARHRR